AGAVKVCEDQGMRLPAGKDANSELDKMYQHRDELGMPSAGYYWSATEYSAFVSWYQNFSTGNRTNFIKGGSFVKARCVR
ncbi:MAG: hypothetical protein WCY19_07200, partial [Candidatus Gastranaerophilaceae bacterium]